MKEYVLANGVRIPVEWRLGWCEQCNGPASVENLSADHVTDDLEAIQAKLFDLPLQPTPAWWQIPRYLFSKTWRNQIAEGERHRFELQSRLDDARDRARFLESQQRPPKCLSCGSTRVHAPLITHSEPWEDRASPQPIGFTHPGCGGAIWRKESGIRIAPIPSIQRYLPDGELFDKEFLNGYSIPDDDFFLEREINNALIRGRAIPVGLAAG